MASEIPNDQLKCQLFAIDEKAYGENYKKHLFEQYALCVEMADKNSARRIASNNFFLSANTLLLTAIGILSKLGPNFAQFSFWWITLSSIAGLLFCWTWAVSIRSYRDLSRAKFRVITAIEHKLPALAFSTEWICLNPENKAARYLQLTRVERYVPIIFAFLFLVLMTISLVLVFLH